MLPRLKILTDAYEDGIQAQCSLEDTIDVYDALCERLKEHYKAVDRLNVAFKLLAAFRSDLEDRA